MTDKKNKPHPNAQEPDIATLKEWVRDTMGEAACPSECWIEHDGHCPHGYPSWVAVLLGV